MKSLAAVACAAGLFGVFAGPASATDKKPAATKPAAAPKAPAKPSTGGVAGRPGAQPAGAMPTAPGAARPGGPSAARPSTTAQTVPSRAPMPTPGRPGGAHPQPTRTIGRNPVGGGPHLGPGGGRPAGIKVVGRDPAHSYRVNGRAYHAWRAAPYRWPPRFHYRAFHRGEYLPAALIVDDYVIADYQSFDLAPPQPGFEWVRVGPDALMVNSETAEVGEVVPGVFSETETVADNGPPPLPPVDPLLPPEFSTGAFALGHGPHGGCLKFYGDPASRSNLDQAWKAQDWNSVALQVVAMGCDTDLSWYLLGLSAEGLGLNQAAEVYYRTAYQVSTGGALNPFKHCTAFAKDDACRSVDVTQESRAGVQRVAPPR